MNMMSIVSLIRMHNADKKFIGTMKNIDNINHIGNADNIRKMGNINTTNNMDNLNGVDNTII